MPEMPVPATQKKSQANQKSRQLQSLAPLLTVGAWSLLIYAAFYIFYNTPALSATRLNRELFTWISAIALGILFVRGRSALNRLVQEADEPAGLYRILLGFALAFACFAVLTPNFHSTDLFGYINRGWQQWHYHSNPYVTIIADLPHWEADPVLTNHWVNNPSPYGFLYMIIAKWLCALASVFSQDERQTFVAVFKAFNLLVFAFTAWLIPHVLKKTQGKQAAIEGLYLFAWNPLLLIHIVINGHNDILMGAAMALAAFLALKGNARSAHWLWLLPVITLATLVKYAALVMLPLALLFLWRQKAYASLGFGVAISAMGGALAGMPYLADWGAFRLDRIQRNAQVSHSSLHAFFYHLYKNLSALFPALKPYHSQVRQIFKNILLALYALLMSGFCLSAWGVGLGRYQSIQKISDKLKIPSQWLSKSIQNFSAARFVAFSCYAVGALVCLVTFKFYPWYLAMVYPMALLLPPKHWFKRILVWLTLSHLLSITFIGQAHVLNYLLMVIVPVALFIWRERNRTKAGIKVISV